MKLLVTGGLGFIGSNFILNLLKTREDISVINLDKLTYAGNPQNLASAEKLFRERYKFIKGDINNRELCEHIFTEFSPDAVINFAAETHVDRSILDPEVFIRTNVMGTFNLINCAKNFWPKQEWSEKRFIQISTDEVYGTLPEDKPELKFKETTPLSPHSPYSAAKTSADCLVQSYYDTYRFPALITRCSNNYGPYQFPEKFIPLIIHRASENLSIPLYGDGKNIRDWLFVKDHCNAVLRVLKRGTPGEVYNIGGNNEQRNIDIAKSILKIMGRPDSLLKFVKDRPGHDRRYAIDASKIKNELGWEPECKFTESLENTVKWYSDNSAWINNITSGEYRNYYKDVYGE